MAARRLLLQFALTPPLDNMLIHHSDGHIFISNQTGNSVLIAICTFSTGPQIVDLRDGEQPYTLNILPYHH
jgi:hypothetical protein